MNKKLILILSIMILAFGVTGCKKENNEIVKDNSSKNYADVGSKDLEIVKWSYSGKEPHNKDKNIAEFMGDVTMGSIDNMSQKSVNINLKKGQSLRIETKTNSPIKVTLKDNSNGDFLFNKTLSPENGNILVDEVEKDGQYELMLDFDSVDEFTFKVYIVGQK